MIRFRRKHFSIQSGQPDKRLLRTPYDFKRRSAEVLSNPVLVGTVTSAGIIGMETGKTLGQQLGYGALALGATMGLTIIINELKHCSDMRKTGSEQNMENVLKVVKREIYDDSRVILNHQEALKRIHMDLRPEDADITFAINKGCGCIYINSTHPVILKKMNEGLDEMLRRNSKVYYTSKRTKTGYVVTITDLTIRDFERLIIAALEISEENSDQKDIMINCISSKMLIKYDIKI